MNSTSLDCVVDASVGIKLCIAEPFSDRADALIARAAADPPTRLYVPDLFYVECANILWKHVQRLGLPPDKALKDIERLRALRLHRTPTYDLASDALPIALTCAISAYDACYVALAQKMGVPLVTADDALIRKLSGSPYAIHSLGSITIPSVP
jgi:predicted nucleic acid-binding protein